MSCAHLRLIRITTSGPESLGRDECADCRRMLRPGSSGVVVRTVHVGSNDAARRPLMIFIRFPEDGIIHSVHLPRTTSRSS